MFSHNLAHHTLISIHSHSFHTTTYVHSMIGESLELGKIPTLNLDLEVGNISLYENELRMGGLHLELERGDVVFSLGFEFSRGSNVLFLLWLNQR